MWMRAEGIAHPRSLSPRLRSASHAHAQTPCPVHSSFLAACGGVTPSLRATVQSVGRHACAVTVPDGLRGSRDPRYAGPSESRARPVRVVTSKARPTGSRFSAVVAAAGCRVAPAHGMCSARSNGPGRPDASPGFPPKSFPMCCSPRPVPGPGPPPAGCGPGRVATCRHRDRTGQARARQAEVPPPILCPVQVWACPSHCGSHGPAHWFGCVRTRLGLGLG
jgi:hypothetical protein